MFNIFAFTNSLSTKNFITIIFQPKYKIMKTTFFFIMKRYLVIILLILSVACIKTANSSSSGSDSPCGSYNGHQLYKGSEGGCYYINSSGNKSYVDRSQCNC